MQSDLEKSLLEQAAKPAGPLDRAPELFAFMAIPSTIYFFYSNQPDLDLLYALIALFAVLSFVGGVITKGSPPKPK